MGDFLSVANLTGVGIKKFVTGGKTMIYFLNEGEDGAEEERHVAGGC